MSTPQDDAYDLFTSLRYDPALKDAFWTAGTSCTLESYHLDRLRDAAAKFAWKDASATVAGPEGATRFRAVCLEAVKAHNSGSNDGPVLIRVTLSKTGNLAAQSFDPVAWPHDLLAFSKFNPTTDAPPNPDTLYRVSVDTIATPSSVFTRNKTTWREHYNAARERAGIKSRGELREVILYNEDGEVMEGSVTNVSFWRGGCWVTPSPSAGGLPGTVRRWLLGQQLIAEGTVRRDDIRDGEFVLLTNSWHIVQLGRVELRA